MKKLFIYSLLVILITSCASTSTPSQYKPTNFYKDYFAYDAEEAKNLLPTADLEVFDITNEDSQEAFANSWSKGYDRIGISSFTGQMGNYNYAIRAIKEHGREIGATRAIFVHRLDRVVDLGSNSTIKCNEYLGTCSSATRNNSYEVHEQSVVYMAKNVYEKPFFGFIFSELTLAQKAEYSTNHGFVVGIIRDGSAFYNAGIVPGDIVLSQDGTKVSNAYDLNKKNISVFEIARKGQRLNIEVKITNQ